MRGKYKFKVDFNAKQYIEIHLNWNYVDRTVPCSMKGYVKQALEEFKHIFTGKHHYAPSKIDRPDYGAKIQFAKIDTATPLLEIAFFTGIVSRANFFSLFFTTFSLFCK